MTIDAEFDGGNIIVESEAPSDVSLLIRPDTGAEYYQWFYFRDINPPPGIMRTYHIFNGSGASYPRAWASYDVLASYDEIEWFRIPTRYDGSHLSWQHTTTEDRISFAFFVPYSEQRRASLVKEAAAAPHVTRQVLGTSIEGRELDELIFQGESGAANKTVWVVSRQHAGEPMAEYATEGFIRRLLDPSDLITQELLSKATVHVVPNMNPDGSASGNLRANAAGVDLNRIWHEPKDNAPEIRAVVDAIASTGCDFLIDMHGDEERPYIWIVGPNIEMSPPVDTIHKQFEAFLAARFPEVGPPPEAILRETIHAPGMSANYIYRTYGCPAWIVELPFCETAEGDTLLAAGCLNFGHHCVEALADVIS